MSSESTMRGIVRGDYGTDWSKVFVFADNLPVPTPGDNQVLLRVHAAAVGSGDMKMAAGWVRSFVSERLPRVGGLDVSGVVVAVGPKVTQWKVGDAVFGDLGVSLQGSFAEYAVANATSLAAKPRSMSFCDAAALPISGLTALAACKQGAIGSGTSVIVRGASGGVGAFVVQLAKAMGASKVIGISSHVDLVTSLGADRCVNYKEADWVAELQGQNIDVFVDCVGGAWADAPRVLKPSRPVFVPVASDEINGPIGVGFVISMLTTTISRKFWSLFGYPKYNLFVAADGQTKELQELVAFAEQGALRCSIAEFPFSKEGAVDMYTQLQAGRVGGKLVMKMCD